MKKLDKRMKREFAMAIIMTITLSALVVYVSRPKRPWSSLEEGYTGGQASMWTYTGSSEIVQVYFENIRGELQKGSFRTVVESLRTLTSFHGGRIPYLSMLYENDVWIGRMTCKVPTENVTLFTFDVEELIREHGKVTYISTIVTETIANQTLQAEEPLSEVSMTLNETTGVGPESPILGQIGMVVSWLVTSLVWIAQGLIIGLPLCFVSLGIVVLIDRGVIPAWKKQFRNRSLSRPGQNTQT